MTPLVPAAGRAPGGRRWSFAVSAALHLAALLVLLTITARRPPPIGNPAPGYDLIFDTPQATSSAPPAPAAAPPPQPANVPVPDDVPSGPPAPTPLVAPSPEAAQMPAAPLAAPSPSPAAASEAPAAVSPPPAALAFAPPPPAAEPSRSPEAVPSSTEPPPTEQAPAVRLQSPDGQLPLALDTTPIMPALPPAPRPRPAPARPVPARPAPSLGTLARPMDLSLAPAPPPPAARGSVASRALDLRVPTGHRSLSRSDPYAEIRAAQASEDWNRGLLRYWLAHRYYPQQAAENGESGTVTVELTVNRSGRVEDVRVVSRSGSQWLDLAAVATFRDAKLPPFTEEMKQDRLTFPVPIHYILLHR